MPAEWEKHRACLILYPHNTGVFRNGPNPNDQAAPSSSSSSSSSAAKGDIAQSSSTGETCAPARYEVRNVARSICRHGKEDVFLLCNTDDDAEELRAVLRKEGGGVEKPQQNQIIVQVCESDDSWCRDTGPTFVRRETIGFSSESQGETSVRELVGLDWKFNAYGGPEEGCYWPCTKDQQVAGNVCDLLSKYYHVNDDKRTTTIANTSTQITTEKIDIILEGGSFHTDGEGTILTTEECLLNPNRNPNLTKDQIESILFTHLGASKIIWLPCGLANDDDTNGHVDNIATFAKPGEVVLSWTDDVNDANYERCKAAEEVLLQEFDAEGRNFVIHKLFLPKPMYYTAEEVNTLDSEHTIEDGIESVADRMVGERLAGSYVNYYLANEAVIVPQFGDDEFDKLAIDTMKSIFPSKEAVGVYSREVLLGGGNIHCITQQVPC